MKKKGILLINLGTPKEATPKEVKKYLRVFLSDRRVIKTHPMLWQPILQGIILNTRPKKSAALYQSIWTEEGFPLLNYTLAQRDNVAKLMPEWEVEIGMSYSEPTIEQSLDSLLKKGVEDLTIIPMYPQYSGTTVGSVFDSVMRFFLGTDKIIDMTFIRSYYDNEVYISYYAKKIKQYLEKQRVDKIVFSYHGIPVSYVTDGDNYPKECEATTQKIMSQVGDVPFIQTYQSKFGPNEWLTPATADTLKSLPSQGVKTVLVVAPGFIVDCLETIEELEEENKGYFIENGGEEFIYLSPFNADPTYAEVVKSIIDKK